MRINEVDNPLSQTELDQLEVFADRLFAKVGIDVEFTRHFLDRVNDERNVKQITASELTRLFKQEYKKWGKPIAELGPDAEAVLKDLATDVNLPFALRWDSVNNELDLIAKTVMRKKNFKTSNKEFTIQSHDYSLDNTQHKLVHESIQALSERKQLNELGPAAIPAGIAWAAVAAWNAYLAARYAKAAWWTINLTGSAISLYIIDDNTGMFSWLEKKVAAKAVLAYELWDNIRGVEDVANNEVVQQELTTLNTELASGVAELTSQAIETEEISVETQEIIDRHTEAANSMDKQIADGVDPSVIAKNYVNSLLVGATSTTSSNTTSSDGASTQDVEAAKEVNYAAGQVIKQVAVISPEVSSAIAAELEKNYQEASGENEARIAAHLEGVNKAIADAKAKANAQNKASDNRLIALATSISQAQKDAASTKASDEKLIALATSVAATQAQAKADAQNKASDSQLIAKAQAHAKAQADAKADAQNTAADDKLIKTAQAVAMQKAAAIQARDAAAKYAKQNKIADAGLIKLATNAAEKAATDAYNNSNEISDNKLKQLAIAAAAATIDKENNKTKSTAVDVTYPIDHHPDDTKKNDVKIATGTYPIGTAFPHTGELPISVGTAATVGSNTNTLAIAKALDVAKSNTTKTKTGKRQWPYGGDSDLWPTNLYKWTQKYGTFENENLITKYFTLNEGGAMPGVGTVHISEIQPTLVQLEKSLGINLQDNTLGSVGKKQFSGDIDVALKIAPEEIPAFIEALTKNPLVSDIRKTSVIMTKVKIQNFDKSKEDPDGRPRTGFVQVDFMPGDPGWLKTYYHTPHEDDSKYKGVYRNIMIATLAAVHNRDESDAKLEDGRAMETRRLMWSPTEGLLRVKRTPVPNKAGTGYTKKNKNETIDGPWKQPDDIAQQLGLDSGKDLNSFESLLKVMQKNWTKEAQQYAVDGFKDNKVIQDIGIPEELQ
ncbi:MAG: hypothetical protein CMD55_03815 [Gammaproteobacteria bacterium]|nr:hypothetical protein [Gammaproteobacteria bacterium]